MSQQPSVGRIVHYHRIDGHSAPCAAIVSDVEPVGWGNNPKHKDSIAATVFLPNTLPIHNSFIPFSETPTPGCWSWPPRV